MSEYVPIRGKLKAPRSIHILSWVLSLDRNGYIPCHLRNCTFMASTLDEMVNHYHLINCLQQFPFTCDDCKLSTDLQEKLTMHKVYVHSYNPTRQEKKDLSIFLDVKKEVSPNLRRGWELYLKNKGFLKCLVKPCSVILETLEEMEDHYLNSCKEEFWSLLISKCKYCQGKFDCGERMSKHVLKYHCTEADEVRTYKAKHPVKELTPGWAQHILASKQAACPLPHCKFLSNNVVLLEKHYSACTGKKQSFYKVCPFCQCWLQNEMKLTEHMRCLHKGETIVPRLEKSNELAEETGSADSSNDASANSVLKKFGEGSCNDSSKVYSDENIYCSSSMKPAFHRRRNKSNSIDCGENDISEIQFSQEVMDLKSLVVEPSVGGTPCLVTQDLLESESNKLHFKNICRKNKMKAPPLAEVRRDPRPLPTSLEEVASNLQGQAAPPPLQIKVDQAEFKVTVNVPEYPALPVSKEDTFPQNIDALYKILRNDSFKLLKAVSKKISPRCDMKKTFVPYEKPLCSLRFSVKRNNRTTVEGTNVGDKNDCEKSTMLLNCGSSREETLACSETTRESLEKSRSIIEAHGDDPARDVNVEDQVTSGADITVHDLCCKDERTDNNQVPLCDMNAREGMKSDTQVFSVTSFNQEDDKTSHSKVPSHDFTKEEKSDTQVSTQILTRESETSGALRNLDQQNLTLPSPQNNSVLGQTIEPFIEDTKLHYLKSNNKTMEIKGSLVNNVKADISINLKSSSVKETGMLSSRSRSKSLPVLSGNRFIEVEEEFHGFDLSKEWNEKYQKYLMKRQKLLDVLAQFPDSKGIVSNKIRRRTKSLCLPSEEIPKAKCHPFSKKEIEMNAKKIAENTISSNYENELSEETSLLTSTSSISETRTLDSKMCNRSAGFEGEQESYITCEKTTCQEENINTGHNITEKYVFIRNTNPSEKLSYHNNESFTLDVTSDPLGTLPQANSGAEGCCNTKLSRVPSELEDWMRDESTRNISDLEDNSSCQDKSLNSEGSNSEKSNMISSLHLFCDEESMDEEYKRKPYYNEESTEQVLLEYREKLALEKSKKLLYDPHTEKKVDDIEALSEWELSKNETLIKNTKTTLFIGPIQGNLSKMRKEILNGIENDKLKTGSFKTKPRNSLGGNEIPLSSRLICQRETFQPAKPMDKYNDSGVGIPKKRGRSQSSVEITNSTNFKAKFSKTSSMSKTKVFPNNDAPSSEKEIFEITMRESKKRGRPRRSSSLADDLLARSSMVESHISVPSNYDSQGTSVSGSPETSFSTDAIEVSDNGLNKQGRRKRSISTNNNQSNSFQTSEKVSSVNDSLMHGSYPNEIIDIKKSKKNHQPQDTKEAVGQRTPPRSSSGKGNDYFIGLNKCEPSSTNSVPKEICLTKTSVIPADFIEGVSPRSLAMKRFRPKMCISQKDNVSCHKSPTSATLNTFCNAMNSQQSSYIETSEVLHLVEGCENVVSDVQSTKRVMSKKPKSTESSLKPGVENSLQFNIKEKEEELKFNYEDTTETEIVDISKLSKSIPTETEREMGTILELKNSKVICKNTEVINESSRRLQENSELEHTPEFENRYQNKKHKNSIDPIMESNSITETLDCHIYNHKQTKSGDMEATKIPNSAEGMEQVTSGLTSKRRGRPKKSISNTSSQPPLVSDNSSPTLARTNPFSEEVIPLNNIASVISNTSYSVEGIADITKKSFSNQVSQSATPFNNFFLKAVPVNAFSKEDTSQNTIVAEVTTALNSNDLITSNAAAQKQERSKINISNEIGHPSTSSGNSPSREALINTFPEEETPQNIIFSEITNTSNHVEEVYDVTCSNIPKKTGIPKINISNVNGYPAATIDNFPITEAHLNDFSAEQTPQNTMDLEIFNTSNLVENADYITSNAVTKKRGRPKRSISYDSRHQAATSANFPPTETPSNLFSKEDSPKNNIVSEIPNPSLPLEDTENITPEATKKKRGRPKKSISHESSHRAASSDFPPSEAPLNIFSKEDTPKNNIVSEIPNPSLPVEDTQNITPDTPIKKRGRPKKSISNELCQPASPSDQFQTEKDNSFCERNPPQNTNISEIPNPSLPLEDTENITPEATKKKRGRPKKSISHEFSHPAASSDFPPLEAPSNIFSKEDTPKNNIVSEIPNPSLPLEDTENITPEAIKKKRGRPKKSISHEFSHPAASSDFPPSEAPLNIFSKEDSPKNNIVSEIPNPSLPLEDTENITPEATKKKRGRPKKSISHEFSHPAVSSDFPPSEAPSNIFSKGDTPKNNIVSEIPNSSLPVEDTQNITLDTPIKKRGRPKNPDEFCQPASSSDKFPTEGDPFNAFCKEDTLHNTNISETSNTSFPVEGTDEITPETKSMRRGRSKRSIPNEFNHPVPSSDIFPPSKPPMNTFSKEDAPKNNTEPRMSNTSFLVEGTENITSEAKTKMRGRPKKCISNEFSHPAASCDNFPLSLAPMNTFSEVDYPQNTNVSKISNTSFPVEGTDKITTEATKKKRGRPKKSISNASSSGNFSRLEAHMNEFSKEDTPQNTIVSETSFTSFPVEANDDIKPDAPKMKRGRSKKSISNESYQPASSSGNFSRLEAHMNEFSKEDTPQNTIISETSFTSFPVEANDDIKPNAPKKKRGRPKKSISDELCQPASSSDKFPTEEVPINAFCRDDTPHNTNISESSNTSFPVEGTDEITPEAAIKRRGRPKKSIPNEFCLPASSSSNIPPEEDKFHAFFKEDTPQNTIISNTSFPVEGITSEATTKKRGRPKKSISNEFSHPVALSNNLPPSEAPKDTFSKDDNPQNTNVPEISNSSIPVEDNDELTPVKKRGRSKKSVPNEISHPAASSGNLPHREAHLNAFSVGDVPQNTVTHIYNISNPVEDIADMKSIAVAKKRGRPRKSISNVYDHSSALFDNTLSAPAKAIISGTSSEATKYVNSDSVPKRRGRPKGVGLTADSNNTIFNDLSLEVPQDDVIKKKKKPGCYPKSHEKCYLQINVKQQVPSASSFDGDDSNDNMHDGSNDDMHDFVVDDTIDTPQNSFDSLLEGNNCQLAIKGGSPVLGTKRVLKRHGRPKGGLLSSTLALSSPSTYSTFIKDLTSQGPSITETSTFDCSSEGIEEFDEVVKNSTSTDSGAASVTKMPFRAEAAGIISYSSPKKRGRPRKDTTFAKETMALTGAYNAKKVKDTRDISECEMTVNNTIKTLHIGAIEDNLSRMKKEIISNVTDCGGGSGDNSSLRAESNEIISQVLPKRRGRPRKVELFQKPHSESFCDDTLKNSIVEERKLGGILSSDKEETSFAKKNEFDIVNNFERDTMNNTLDHSDLMVPSESGRTKRMRNKRRLLFLDESDEYLYEEQPEKKSCRRRSDSLHSSSPTNKRVLSGRIESWTKLEDPDKEVTCAVCEESMTALSYQSDHLKKHNFMCWIVGEEPWPLDDENYMVNVLTRGRRRFPGFVFKCELCNDQRKSAKGFLTHKQFCGNEEAMNNLHDSSPGLRGNRILGSDSDGETPSTSRKIPEILSNSGMLQGSAERYSLYQQLKEEEEKSLTDRQIRIRILSGRIDATTKLREPNKQVKCAVCGETMTAREYQKKHLLKHNFIAWLEGEEPLPLDDPECMTNVLQRGKLKNPRFVFTCDICNERKKSSLGFLSHRQFCGRSEEERRNLLVSCEYCGRVMMPFSLPTHIYQVHRTTAAEEGTPTTEPMRKAASRCMDKLATAKEALIDDDDDDEEKHFEDENVWESEGINTLYDHIYKRPSKNLTALWKFQEARGDSITCSSPQCNFTCSSYFEILEHFKTCPSNLSSFSCLRCHYTSKNMDKMKDHVQHCVLLSDQPEDEINDLNVIPYLKSEEGDYPFRIKLNFFKPALNWTKNLTDVNLSKETVHVDFEEGWEKVMGATRFMPERSTSLPFCYNTSVWSELSLFEGKIQDGGKEGLSFSGGPIWGLEWCPTSGPQYLAVGSQPSMETHFQVGSTYNGPGLIQIWALGNLNNTEGGKLERLELEFGLCHEERGCWDLAWCPGGGESETRLGLLAVATTSGTIPIFPVPQPHTLPLHETRYYKVKPAVKLELPSNEKWQCSAISWSKKKPHRIIVAGFVNGMVGVWDLSSTSSLLRVTPGSLCAHKVFQAHNSFVTGICLSPESEDFLVSTGFDKSLKFWDLRDTGTPQTVSSRGLPTAVDWLRHWMMATTAFDVAYTSSNSTVALSSLRGYMQQTLPVVATIDSTAWDVSCNDWLNAVAACFDNGQVLVYFPVKQHILLHHKDRKRYSKVILQSSLKEYSREESEPVSNSNHSKKSDSSTLYSESFKKYGLDIQTDIKIQPLGNNDILKENTNEGPIDIYPMTSINRVSWNPNMESFTYLASGYQSGFLVVTKLSFPKREQAIIDTLNTKD